MSLVGLSLPSQYLQSTTDQPPVANFTLRPDQLELAIAKTAAQLMWMAGQMGSDGAVQPGEGVALVSENVIALRLNITLLPVSSQHNLLHNDGLSTLILVAVCDLCVSNHVGIGFTHDKSI